MKKTLLLLTVLAFATVAATAQSQPSGTASHDHSAKTSQKAPPLKDLNGTISDDGKTFTADRGKQTWTLKNPEDVKGHEGHHVKLNAHVYNDTKELHVMKVTMLNQKSAKK